MKETTKVENVDMKNIKIFLKWLSKMFDNNITVYNVTLRDMERFLINETAYDANEVIDEYYESCEDCNGTFQDVVIKYGKSYHIYVALIVCFFGTVANVLNVAVLTRKDMACAPINRILTGLAVADMLIMLEYIPFAYYYYVELPGKMNFPYSGAVFMLFHTHFTQILHTISICLTLTLAIWRYLAIGYPDQNHILCSEGRCTLGISLSYLIPIILCSPTFFIFKISSTVITEDKKYTLYHLDLSQIAKENEAYLVLNFWMYGVVIKLLPCCILTVISIWLIRTLFIAKKRKQVLRGYNACPVADGNQNLKSKSKAERRADRTTKMLVAVLLLFLLTEFPQGMFGLLIGMKGKCIFLKCYQNCGALMDILALLNGSINFILYCWMNRMFRLTFGQLFKSKILAKWVPPGQSEVYTTSNVTDEATM